MIHRMGNNDGGASVDPLWLVVGITMLSIGIYQIFKPTQQSLNPVYVPENEASQSFLDMNAVAVRLGQIRELWSMGYLGSQETVSQLEGLKTAIGNLRRDGKASAASAQEFSMRIDRMIEDILEYQLGMA